MAEPVEESEDLQKQYDAKVKERNVVKGTLRDTYHKKRPDNETLVVKIPGEEAQEYPRFRKKRSRSPRRVEIQTEKPPTIETSSNEKVRNKKMFGLLINHLQKAKDEIVTLKETSENQQKIEMKVTQDIKKMNDELKMQTREEIAKVRETEMKKKKDLDEEISRLENEIKVAGSQKTGHSKRMESYRKYILTE